ncbi:hypothetical protein NCCP1664_20300 [Zafaria cholistanensis]|uniref:DUF3093 domain-containing protein n=1 Tax=Zafaria cholistanensis TaxID=1682741 RepID=A0A5A7NRY4_9MICC|nr:DUF3093 domain-containing protein [Zafaria cholistanensis]GER23535.1 hypothetical protein NCCP1664_20300 [Zafaria cholistanensis]
MPEPQPPSTPAPLFQERLWPAWWVWPLVLGTGAAAFVALAPISIGAGIASGTVVALALAVALLVQSPTITVTAETLRVGRASIERRHIGAVDAHRGEAATYQRGRGLNGTAYLCLRGWIDPVVRIQITDELDATPYWLASTRRPEELSAALGGKAEAATEAPAAQA